MLLNEFRLIGTVLSDFEKSGTDNFVKYSFNLEVEKKNKKEPSVYSITVFEKNNSIDLSKSLKVKQIIVQGYLDTYKDFVRLIAQDIMVIGAVPEAKKKVESANLQPLDLPENDLPF